MLPRLILLQSIEGTIMTSHSNNGASEPITSCAENYHVQGYGRRIKSVRIKVGISHTDDHPPNTILEVGFQHESVLCSEEAENNSTLTDPSPSPPTVRSWGNEARSTRSWGFRSLLRTVGQSSLA